MNFNDEKYESLHREIRPSLESDMRPTNSYPVWEPGLSEEEREKKRNDINTSYSENTKLMYESKAKSAVKSSSKRASSSIVHQVSSSEELFAFEAIFSIKGLEFLSEGFFDIEPLLYKDDYLFKSKEDREQFEESEKSMKQQRIEQYEKKIKKSKREITLASIDKHKNNLEEFLEVWVEQNNRKMNKTEIQSAAMILNCDINKLNDFQQAYLKKRKLINSHKLYLYLKPLTTRSKRVAELPKRIRRFFEGSQYMTEMHLEESNKRISDVSGVTLSFKPSSNENSFKISEDYYNDIISTLQKNLINSHYKSNDISNNKVNEQNSFTVNHSMNQNSEYPLALSVSKQQLDNSKISQNVKGDYLNVNHRTVFPINSVSTFQSVSSIPISTMVNEYNKSPFDYRLEANARMMDKNNSLNMTDQVSAYNKDPFGYRPKICHRIPLIQRDSIDPYQANEIEKKIQRASEPQSFSSNEKIENRTKNNMTLFSPNKNMHQNHDHIEINNSSEIHSNVQSSSSIAIKQYTLAGDQISVHKLSPVVVDEDLIQHVVTERKSNNGEHKISLSVYSSKQGCLLEKELTEPVNPKSLHTVVENQTSEIHNKNISKYIMLRDDSERNISCVELKPYMSELKKAKLADLKVVNNEWVLKESNKESQYFVNDLSSKHSSKTGSPQKTVREESINSNNNRSMNKVNSVMTPKKSVSPLVNKKDSHKKSYSQLAQKSTSKNSVAKESLKESVIKTNNKHVEPIKSVNNEKTYERNFSRKSKNESDFVQIDEVDMYEQKTLLIPPMSIPMEVDVYAINDANGQGLGTVYSKSNNENGEIIHYLPSFNVGGQYLNQIVKETTLDNKSVKLEVITMTEKGNEIGRLNIDRKLSGQTYCNILNTGNSPDGKLTNVLITTFNDRGQLLLNQAFEINNLVSLNKKGVKEEILEETFENGDVVTTNIKQEGNDVTRSVRTISNSVNLNDYYTNLKTNIIKNINEKGVEDTSCKRESVKSIPIFVQKRLSDQSRFSQSISTYSNIKPKGLSQVNSQFSVSDNGNLRITISGMINSNTIYQTRNIEIPVDTPSTRSNVIAKTIYEMENELRELQLQEGITTISYQMAVESKKKLNVDNNCIDEFTHEEGLENSQISTTSKIENAMRNQTSAPMLGFNENDLHHKVKSNTITHEKQSNEFKEGFVVPEIHFLKKDNSKNKFSSVISTEQYPDGATNDVQLHNHFSGFEEEKSSTSLKNIDLPTAAFPSKISAKNDILNNSGSDETDLKKHHEKILVGQKYFQINESIQEYEEDKTSNNVHQIDFNNQDELKIEGQEYMLNNRGMSRGIGEVNNDFIKPMNEDNTNDINQSTRSNSYREYSTIESESHIENRNISVNNIEDKSFRKESDLTSQDTKNNNKSVSTKQYCEIRNNSNGLEFRKQSNNSDKKNDSTNSKTELHKSKVSDNKIDQILDNTTNSDDEEKLVDNKEENIITNDERNRESQLNSVVKVNENNQVSSLNILNYQKKSSINSEKSIMSIATSNMDLKANSHLNQSVNKNSLSSTIDKVSGHPVFKESHISETTSNLADPKSIECEYRNSTQIGNVVYLHDNIILNKNSISTISNVDLESKKSIVEDKISTLNGIENVNDIDKNNIPFVYSSQESYLTAHKNQNSAHLNNINSKNSFKKLSESLNNQIILEESSAKEKESINSKNEVNSFEGDETRINDSNLNKDKTMMNRVSEDKVTLSSVFVSDPKNKIVKNSKDSSLKLNELNHLSNEIEDKVEVNSNHKSIIGDYLKQNPEISLFKDIKNLEIEKTVLKTKNHDSCGFKNYDSSKEVRFSLPSEIGHNNLKETELKIKDIKDKETIVSETPISILDNRTNKSTQVSNMTTSVPLIITNDLLEKSVKLKSHLDEFISSISSQKEQCTNSQKPLIVSAKNLSSSLSTLKNMESINKIPSQITLEHGANEFSRKVSNAVQANRNSIPHHDFERLQKTLLQENSQSCSLMESFQKFCKEKLPNDNGYKDSMLLTTMFYYFIKKAEKQ